MNKLLQQLCVNPTEQQLNIIKDMALAYGKDNLEKYKEGKTSQSHGLFPEDIIRVMLPNSSKGSHTEMWDFPKGYDIESGFATSIKSSQSNKLEMGHAVRIFGIDESFRIVWFRYLQVGDFKEFYECRVYVISREQIKILFGKLTLGPVTIFHEKILNFPKGQEEAGRAFAKAKKDELHQLGNLIKLNHKIDSDQRRLQCSISKSRLEEVVSPYAIYPLDRGLWRIWSPPRIRNKKNKTLNNDPKKKKLSLVPRVSSSSIQQPERIQILYNSESKLWEAFDKTNNRRIARCFKEQDCQPLIKGYLKQAS
jgi:hypothetical protein